MKFCYLDESGTGNEPYAIMVGIIVDSQRMHITKQSWYLLLQSLSKICNRTIKEFHTRDFYRGNSPWRSLSGEQRTKIITVILKWMKNRKHKISFCGIDKAKYFTDIKKVKSLKGFDSLWCMLALHQTLIIQKKFQSEPRNKGNTVLIFDNEEDQKKKFAKIFNKPPKFTDEYYDRNPKEERLNQIIDVPYYGDSEEVHLLQVADLIAYILRRYTEIQEGGRVKYADEKEKISAWTKMITKIALPRSSRYPTMKRDPCSDIFFNYAPISLRQL